MKPQEVEDDVRRVRPSTVSGSSRNMEHSLEPMTHLTPSSSVMTSAGLEARITNIERIVTSIQHTVNEHDKKLETSIQLQRQILALLQGQSSLNGSSSSSGGGGGGGGGDGGASVNQSLEEDDGTTPRLVGRRGRRY
jgi:preprotein translocase subunit YajC